MNPDYLYDLMCRYLIGSGWRREEAASGWWWKAEALGGEAPLGEAVADQLQADGVDLRQARSWEPKEFWSGASEDHDEATSA